MLYEISHLGINDSSIVEGCAEDQTCMRWRKAAEKCELGIKPYNETNISASETKNHINTNCGNL